MLEVLQTICSVLVWVACPLLILLILVQGGAGDVSSAFGGGGQLDSALGVGANKKLSQVTGLISVGFLVSIIILAIPVEKSLGEDKEIETPAAMSSGEGDDLTPSATTSAGQVVDPETPSVTSAAIVETVTTTAAATTTTTAPASGGVQFETD